MIYWGVHTCSSINRLPGGKRAKSSDLKETKSHCLLERLGNHKFEGSPIGYPHFWGRYLTHGTDNMTRDEAEFFFHHTQGSGRILLIYGGTARKKRLDGYDSGQNDARSAVSLVNTIRVQSRRGQVAIYADIEDTALVVSDSWILGWHDGLKLANFACGVYIDTMNFSFTKGINNVLGDNPSIQIHLWSYTGFSSTVDVARSSAFRTFPPRRTEKTKHIKNINMTPKIWHYGSNIPFDGVYLLDLDTANQAGFNTMWHV